MSKWLPPSATTALDRAHSQGMKAEARLRQLGYPLGAATPIMGIRGFDTLSRAMEQTIRNTVRQQKELMLGFGNRMESRYGKMADPVAIAVSTSTPARVSSSGITRYARLRAEGQDFSDLARAAVPWPAILNKYKEDIILYLSVADRTGSQFASEENINFIWDVMEECIRLAKTTPSANGVRARDPRTFAHMGGFHLGVISAGSNILRLYDSGNIAAVKNDKLAINDQLMIVNVTEYASTLEAYFDAAGKGGIMYAAFNKYKPWSAGRLDMRFTYIHPDQVTPDISKFAYARRRDVNRIANNRLNGRSAKPARAYRLILPAIVFGRVGSMLGVLNSKPGEKKAKGGYRYKNSSGRFSRGVGQ